MQHPHYLDKLKREREDKVSYDEKELEILRKAVDLVESRKGKETMRDPEVQKIIEMVEHFIADKKLVCYGGTAINNILPEDAQFYDKDIELPDYDFYSDNALEDAKELADMYYKAGYEDVEAKAGVHFGTYKVRFDMLPPIFFEWLCIWSYLGQMEMFLAGKKYRSGLSY